MTIPDIALRRLHNHQLEAPVFGTPEEVVRWMGAVQAQEYAFAKWALGMRLRIDITETAIEQAFNAGRILRTHLMRPTWHFVLPEDIRWMQALTASRVIQTMASRYRLLEIDDDLLSRSFPVIEKALEGGRQLTRREIGAALEKSGIHAQGERLGHIAGRAELEGLICSGPRIGRQFTYMLLAERAPHARELPLDEALAKLTRRYFRSHGPATTQDFAWWSGLTIGDAKAGLEMLRSQLEQEVVDGKAYWYDLTTDSSSKPELKEDILCFHLLPVLDEFTNGYKGYSPILDPQFAERLREAGRSFSAFYTFNGQVAGMWKRTIQKDAVHITRMPFIELGATESEAFALAAGCFGDFIGMHVVLD
jgi:Winged helix DNA-binding domain